MSVMMCLKFSPHTLGFNFSQQGQRKQQQQQKKWNHWMLNAMREIRVGKRK